MKSILVAINSKYVHTALGLRYVNEFCRKNAIEVTLIEETIQTPLLAVLAEITRAKPEVVGFSVHIWNKTYVYSLIELVRKVLPVAKNSCLAVLRWLLSQKRIFNEKVK